MTHYPTAAQTIQEFGIKLDDIKLVTYKNISMDIEATVELLKKTEESSLLEDIFIQTENEIIYSSDSSYGTKLHYIPIPKPSKKKITPISLTQTWWGKDFDLALPFKSDRTLREEEKYIYNNAKKSLAKKENFFKEVFSKKNKNKINSFEVFSAGYFGFNEYSITVPKEIKPDNSFGWDFNTSTIDEKFKNLITLAGFVKKENNSIKTIYGELYVSDLEGHFSSNERKYFPEKVDELTIFLKEELEKALHEKSISYYVGFTKEDLIYCQKKYKEFENLTPEQVIELLIEHLKEKIKDNI